MNNYCTNCGKKLENGSLACKECNTPVIDLPYNYQYKSSEQKEKKKVLKKIGLCILCIVALYVIIFIGKKIRIYQLKKEYVESYLKDNYGNTNYSIKFDSTGKCMVSGNCSLEKCTHSEYLDKKECKSYYYYVKNDTEEFLITVVNMDKRFYAVEGTNIYGRDKGKNKKTFDKIQKEYVEPFIKENYGNIDYTIEFDSYGKCIVSGDCFFDFAMGCDGGSCEEYKYLDFKDCESYYYFVKTDMDKFVVTVVNKNEQFYVVEGENIYGNGKKYSDIDNNYNSNIDEE